MAMETRSHGWEKTHIGCGGIVRFEENLDDTHWEWDLFCVGCNKHLTEEEVDFRRVVK